MTKHKHSSTVATALKLGELSVAAPQVVAHRITRMALNGPFYSKQDQTEFIGMVQEKQLAFAQSWLAMFAEVAKIQQELWLFWAKSFMRPAGFTWPIGQIASGVLRVTSKGLSPVHSKAVANSKRLSRVKLKPR